MRPLNSASIAKVPGARIVPPVGGRGTDGGRPVVTLTYTHGGYIRSRSMADSHKHVHGGAPPRGAAHKAVAVDPETKRTNLLRLRRIEGQVRGIANMVEADRYCADIITQIAAVQEALRVVSRRLLRNHLKHCATAAIRAGEAEAEAMYDELVDLFRKGIR